MLSKTSQSERDKLWIHLYVESKKSDVIDRTDEWLAEVEGGWAEWLKIVKRYKLNFQL